MSDKSRTISAKTLKSLYSHSGNLCNFPNCTQTLMENENTNISNICHINGLNKDSARYDEKLSVEYLNSEGNLILLCQNHHALVDANPDKFSVEILKQMKARHESNVATALSAVGQLIPNPATTCYDYSQIQTYLLNHHEIEMDIEKIKCILNIFSCQAQDIKTVMTKILDVYNRHPKNHFKMTAVINELSFGNVPAGHSSYVISLIKYLLESDYIREWKYELGLNSLMDDGEGGLCDVSEDYPFRIEHGEWDLTVNGSVVDSLYNTHGSLQ